MLDWDAAARDAADLLRTLSTVRAAHQKRSGRPSLDALASFLREREIPIEVLDDSPSRAGLVARIPSGRARPPLALLVLLEGDAPGAAMATAFALVSARRLALSRDVLLLAVPGGPTRGRSSLASLVARGPKPLEVGFVIGPGGGREIRRDRTIFHVETAEKGILRLRLSIPNGRHADSAGRDHAASILAAVGRIDGYALPLRRSARSPCPAAIQSLRRRGAFWRRSRQTTARSPTASAGCAWPRSGGRPVSR